AYLAESRRYYDRRGEPTVCPGEIQSRSVAEGNRHGRAARKLARILLAQTERRHGKRLGASSFSLRKRLYLTIPSEMVLDALHRIANHGQSLARAEAREVMAEVLAGNCTDAQIAALLVALRMKGETVEEIVGFAEAIRAAATPLPIASASALDLSGTGRDA